MATTGNSANAASSDLFIYVPFLSGQHYSKTIAFPQHPKIRSSGEYHVSYEMEVWLDFINQLLGNRVWRDEHRHIDWRVCYLADSLNILVGQHNCLVDRIVSVRKHVPKRIVVKT